MIVILTAVILEAQPIAAALGLGNISATHWSGQRVQLRVAGIRAARFSARMVPSQIQGIILAGLAGALDPTLTVGDVLIDSASTPLPAAPPCRIGAIHCAECIAATPAAKAALLARSGALAVEMEGDVIRRFAAAQSLPFLHVRAISDTAAESINPAILKLVDPLGNPKPLAITAALLKNPSLIPTLKHLQRNATLAAANLAEILSAIVSKGWPRA